MGAETKKVEIAKGLTPRAIVWSLILSIIMVWLCTQVYFTTGAFSFFNPWPYSHTVGAQIVETVGLLTLVVLLTSLLGKTFRLTPQELTVIMTACLIAAMPVGPYVAHWTMNFALGANKPGIAEAVAHLVPKIWVPPAEATTNYLIGGPVPWDILAPYLVTWIIAWTLWGYLNIAFSLLWRRSVIDIEKLPFPYAVAGVEFINIATGEDKPKFLNIKEYVGKSFWVSFIIGFFAYLPLAIRIAIPWFPVPVMKGSAYLRNWWMINFYDELKGLAPWAPWAIWPIPEVTALAYLVPIDILFTVVAAYAFFFYIFPPIEFSLGIAPPPPPGGFSDWYHAYKFYARKVGLKPQAIFETGGIWAFAIFSIIFHWKYIREIIDYIKKPPADEKEAEPLSYKALFSMFALFFIIYCGFMISMGVPAGLAPILLILTCLIFYAELLMRAEAGPFGYWWSEPTQIFYANIGGTLGLWSWPASDNPAAYSTAYWAVQFHGYNLGAQPGVVSMDAYKIAKSTKTSPREILITQLIFTPIVFALAFLFTAYSSYALGIEKAFRGRPVVTSWSKSWVYGVLKEPLMKHAYWAGPGDLPLALSAFIIFPIVMLLRMKFPWFIINPVGLILFCGHEAKLFGPFFIALIIKYAVLKLGGTKLYQKGIPIVLGFISGCAISRIVVALCYFAAGIPAPI